MCDDIERTMAELTASGAEFSGPVTQASFGLMTSVVIPGGGTDRAVRAAAPDGI